MKKEKTQEIYDRILAGQVSFGQDFQIIDSEVSTTSCRQLRVGVVMNFQSIRLRQQLGLSDDAVITLFAGRVFEKGIKLTNFCEATDVFIQIAWHDCPAEYRLDSAFGRMHGAKNFSRFLLPGSYGGYDLWLLDATASVTAGWMSLCQKLFDEALSQENSEQEYFREIFQQEIEPMVSGDFSGEVIYYGDFCQILLPNVVGECTFSYDDNGIARALEFISQYNTALMQQDVLSATGLLDQDYDRPFDDPDDPDSGFSQKGIWD